MRLIPFAAAASLIAALAVPLAAQPMLVPPDGCQDVFAEGESTWMPDAGAELGKLAGLLNGSFYLAYQDEGEPTKLSAPNFVIKSDDGALQLWMAGKSFLTDEGTWSRELVSIAAEGSGIYADAKVDLLLTGPFAPEKGGTYQLVGTICGPIK
jgi:hypothetical protein